jgi:competence protein ComGF
VGDNIFGGDISVIIRKYTIAYPILCYTFVVMRRLVWEFLNSKFEDKVIYRRVWDRADSVREEFLTEKGDGVIQFSRYRSLKEIRTRVNSHVKKDIKMLFDVHDFDIEIYVLEWCRDKAIDVETIEM